MKKITLFAVAALAISLVSCKKDRVCECTNTTGGGTYVSTTTIKSGKKDAAAWCEASNGSKTTSTYNGVSVPASGNITTTCAIK